MKDYIRPSDDIIKEVVAGTYNVCAMPYQYINWAFVQLGKVPTAYIGDRMEIGMIVDFHKACLEWSVFDE